MSERFGIIGCGRAGLKLHAPVISANPRSELAAFCDLDEEAAERAASKFDVASYTDSVKMIEEENLYCVTVATPPGTHYEVIKQVAPSGVNAIVEKPFSETIDRAEEMIDLMLKNGGKVTEINSELFHPAITRARESIKSGELGSVRSVVYISGEDWFVLGEEGIDEEWLKDIPGGPYGEGLMHIIYILRSFIGNVSEANTLFSSKPEPESPFDVGSSIFRLEGEKGRGLILRFMDANIRALYIVAGTKKTIVIVPRQNYIKPMSHEEIHTEKSHDPMVILKDNLKDILEIGSGTFQGGSIQMKKGLGEIWPADGVYEFNGHYQQITEMVENDQDEFTVRVEDILDNISTFQKLISQISEK